jgi:cephalosporin hydroxylase
MNTHKKLLNTKYTNKYTALKKIREEYTIIYVRIKITSHSPQVIVKPNIKFYRSAQIEQNLHYTCILKGSKEKIDSLAQVVDSDHHG